VRFSLFFFHLNVTSFERKKSIVFFHLSWNSLWLCKLSSKICLWFVCSLLTSYLPLNPPPAPSASRDTHGHLTMGSLENFDKHWRARVVGKIILSWQTIKWISIRLLGTFTFFPATISVFVCPIRIFHAPVGPTFCASCPMSSTSYVRRLTTGARDLRLEEPRGSVDATLGKQCQQKTTKCIPNSIRCVQKMTIFYENAMKAFFCQVFESEPWIIFTKAIFFSFKLKIRNGAW
jgi:hypothetical protein